MHEYFSPVSNACTNLKLTYNFRKLCIALENFKFHARDIALHAHALVKQFSMHHIYSFWNNFTELKRDSNNLRQIITYKNFFLYFCKRIICPAFAKIYTVRQLMTAAAVLSIAHSTPHRRARVRGSRSQTSPCTLMAPGACKIRCVCNVLQEFRTIILRDDSQTILRDEFQTVVNSPLRCFSLMLNFIYLSQNCHSNDASGNTK